MNPETLPLSSPEQQNNPTLFPEADPEQQNPLPEVQQTAPEQTRNGNNLLARVAMRIATIAEGVSGRAEQAAYSLNERRSAGQVANDLADKGREAYSSAVERGRGLLSKIGKSTTDKFVELKTGASNTIERAKTATNETVTKAKEAQKQRAEEAKQRREERTAKREMNRIHSEALRDNEQFDQDKLREQKTMDKIHGKALKENDKFDSQKEREMNKLHSEALKDNLQFNKDRGQLEKQAWKENKEFDRKQARQERIEEQKQRAEEAKKRSEERKAKQREVIDQAVKTGREKLNQTKEVSKKVGKAALRVSATTGLVALGASIIASEAAARGAKHLAEVSANTGREAYDKSREKLDMTKGKVKNLGRSAMTQAVILGAIVNDKATEVRNNQHARAAERYKNRAAKFETKSQERYNKIK